MLYTRRVTSDNAEFRSLVKLLDEELSLTYGEIQKQYDKLNKTENIETAVVGYNDNEPLGCGCFKIFNKDSIEIKRMFVKAKARGSGIAKKILLELENWAIEKGFAVSVLETGIKQEAAIRFYEKLGYSIIENYGPYIGNPNSICMSKKLTK